MNCVDCKDFTCPHRSESTGGRPCYYESGEQKEKLLTMTAEANLHYVDWSAFRREAAKDILCALIIHCSLARGDAARIAIEYADELIKQIKEEEQK